MALIRLAPLFALLTLTVDSAQEREHFFVRISDDNKYFNGGNVINEITLSSVIECGLECLRLVNCTSYNAKTEQNGEVTCEFLSDIPLSPEKDITSFPGQRYFEKTCQVELNPTVASEYEEGNNTYIPNVVYVGGNGGTDVYIIKLSPADDILSVTYHTSVTDKTDGSFQRVMGMAPVILGYEHRVSVYLLETGVMCINKTTSEVPCFADPIVSKTFMFKTEDVNALLATPDFKGMYAFGTSRITVVKVSTTGFWSITNTIDLLPGNRPNGWLDIPRRIVGAAWLIEADGSAPSKAFLLTRHYYVVYDFNNDAILKRGHLCPPLGV